jgi:hypothetical protein
MEARKQSRQLRLSRETIRVISVECAFPESRPPYRVDVVVDTKAHCESAGAGSCANRCLVMKIHKPNHQEIILVQSREPPAKAKLPRRTPK